MTMMRKSPGLVGCLSTLALGAAAFSAGPSSAPPRSSTSLSAAARDDGGNDAGRALTGAALSLALLTSPLHNGLEFQVAHADEWGKETEAPTLFTGETTMICKRRGPLGACLETTVRTVENDNDKALKYFVDPSPKVKSKQERMMKSADDNVEGNELIARLRRQSEENKEKNDLIVRQKTLANDQSASFGPFDRQVVILNTDGKTFTLLQNPQAMRLKKAGYIEDRKFVIQPSRQVIDEALEAEGGLGDAIRGFFGRGGGGEGEAAAPAEAADIEVLASQGVESVEEVSVANDKVEEVSLVKENAGDASVVNDGGEAPAGSTSDSN